MILSNFLVGLPVMLACIAIQAYVAFWCVRHYVRQARRMKPEDHAIVGIRPLLVAMVRDDAGHVCSNQHMGVLFIFLGEFSSCTKRSTTRRSTSPRSATVTS